MLITVPDTEWTPRKCSYWVFLLEQSLCFARPDVSALEQCFSIIAATAEHSRKYSMIFYAVRVYITPWGFRSVYRCVRVGVKSDVRCSSHCRSQSAQLESGCPRQHNGGDNERVAWTVWDSWRNVTFKDTKSPFKKKWLAFKQIF